MSFIREGKWKDLFMFSGLGWNKLGVNLKENYATPLEGLPFQMHLEEPVIQ